VFSLPYLRTESSFLHMASKLACMNLLVLFGCVMAEVDFDDLSNDGITDEIYAEHTNVALLQANISRLRSGGMQVEQEIVYHLHIPKIAGSSYKIDAEEIIKGSSREFSSSEGCFYGEATPEVPDAPSSPDHVIAMVREPLSHIVSMFRYCVYNRNWQNHGPEFFGSDDSTVWEQSVTEWEEDPQAMSAMMEEWLQAWVDQLDAGTVTGLLPQTSGVRPGGSPVNLQTAEERPNGSGINCYVPVNLQTHRFQCEDRDVHLESLSTDLAIENMRSLWVLGLQEEYEASLCLLHARARGVLPAGCACDSRDQLDLVRVNANDPTARPVLTQNMRELINRITSQDQALYAAAVARFHEEVAQVEAEFGVNIVCNDDDN